MFNKLMILNRRWLGWSVSVIPIVVCLCAIAVHMLSASTVSAAGYSPAQGPLFNNPTGSTAQQAAITDELERMIVASPKGAVIRIATFSLTLQSFSDKLVAAHQRGVYVRILMDDHAVTPQWRQLEAVLGADSSALSYARLCRGGCMTQTEGSALHAKLYMFSTAGSAKRVAVVSSSNPTRSQQVNGWNNAYVSIGNDTMYKAYISYFNAMVAGSNGNLDSNYYWSQLGGQEKAYFSPRRDAGAASDTILSVLGNISCSGAASGYGSNGKTTIKVDMHFWTGNRMTIAKKLWQLDNSGCVVQVVYHNANTNKNVLAELSKAGGRYGGPSLLDSERDSNGDGKADVWTHNKTVLISGVYVGNVRAKVVFAGSHNFTHAALYQNNDILLRLTDDSVYDAYANNFATIWNTSKALPL